MEQPEPDPQKSVNDPSQSAVGGDLTNQDSPTGYARTGKLITAWTSNLLATAVVIIIALVAGKHLVSSFGTLTQEANDSPLSSELVQAWPTLESCALQFGNSNLELQRDSLSGSRDQVVGFLRAKCRAILEKGDLVVGEQGSEESKLINELLEKQTLKPVEQNSGRWRIFEIENAKVNSPLPLVIGILDNGSIEATSKKSRLAVWGLALRSSPENDKGKNKVVKDNDPQGSTDDIEHPRIETENWTSFVGRAAVPTALNQLKNDLIPDDSQRTVSIAGVDGGSLIGFKGGDLDQTTAFFDRLASNRSWKTTQRWRKSAGSVSARYELPKESPAQAVQVQLYDNPGQSSPAQMLRGMLVLQIKPTNNHTAKVK